MKKRVLALLMISMATVFVACGNEEKMQSTDDHEIIASHDNESKEAAISNEVDKSEDTTDEVIELTQDELDTFTEMFNSDEYNGFLVKPFDNEASIEWEEVLYNGAGIAASDVSKEEIEAFYKQIGMTEEEACGDLITLRANDIKSFVESHSGVQYDDMKNQIGFEYVAEYDSYYSMHGDSNFMLYTCVSGYKHDDIYVLQLNNDSYGDEENSEQDVADVEVSFEKNGDSYKMISNVRLH